MEKLTLQQLKDMKPHEIFARGETSVEDYWDTSKEMQVRWIATRVGVNWLGCIRPTAGLARKGYSNFLPLNRY